MDSRRRDTASQFNLTPQSPISRDPILRKYVSVSVSQALLHLPITSRAKEQVNAIRLYETALVPFLRIFVSAAFGNHHCALESCTQVNLDKKKSFRHVHGRNHM